MLQNQEHKRINAGIDLIIKEINDNKWNDKHIIIANIVEYVNINSSGYTIAFTMGYKFHVVDSSYVNKDGGISFIDTAFTTPYIVLENEISLKEVIWSAIENKFGFQGNYNTDKVLDWLEGFLTNED